MVHSRNKNAFAPFFVPVFASIAVFTMSSSSAFAETPISTPEQAEAVFSQLKELEGVWQRAGQPEHGHRIEFRTTARDTVLIEKWTYLGQQHSLTIYHRDGDTLLATHYCPQGNQPRMELASGDAAINFTFRDATDLDLETEQYQHDLSLKLSEDGQLIRSEIYKDGQGHDHPGVLVLERVVPED